ncbi:hypothetical protein K1719_004280 [Acacia pycnantha]|nr:hypothetical protein K1719_004280 [Acacia pycnantha]
MQLQFKETKAIKEREDAEIEVEIVPVIQEVPVIDHALLEKLTAENQKLKENGDALINCVTKNIGFSNGKPVSAITIYKCLLHWKSFEAERTSVFNMPYPDYWFNN